MTKGHFLDGRQVIFDSTTLGVLKTCLAKYDMTFRQDWVPKAPNEHLKFGILAHEGRQEYYKQILLGLSHDEAVREVLSFVAYKSGDYKQEDNHEVFTPWISTHKTKDLYHLLLLLVSYLDHFRNDACKTYMLENGRPAVELSFKLEIEHPWMLSGHIDRVVTFDGDLYITDLKTTTGTLNDNYFADYKPNNQISLYDFAGQVILPRKPVGIIIDAIQILANGIYLQRRIVKRTDAERAEWYDALLDKLNDHERYAAENYWPMNDTACSHYGGCVFRGVCSLPPHLRQAELRTRFQKKIWDPTQNR